MKKWPNTEQFDELLGSELDLDQAWSEFKKDKKKTRRLPFWWCFAFGGILLLGIVGYFGGFINLKKENQERVAYIVDSPIVVPPVENIPLSTPEKQSRRQIEQTVKTNSTNSTTSAITSTIALGRNEQKIVPSLKRERLLNLQNSVNVKSKSERLLNFKNLVNVNSDPIPKLEEKHGYKENSDLLSPKTSATRSIENQSVNNDKQSENAILEVPPIASLVFNLSYERAEKFPLLYEKDYPSNSKQWSLGINYSLANANRNLSEGLAAYTQRRQEEKFLESNKLEIVLSKNLAKRFFFQTGVSLTQYRAKLAEEIQTITSPVLYEDVVTETHTKGNLTQEIIGIAEGSQVALNRYIRFQRYQMLSIPLRLGVRFPLSHKWQIAASSGIAISLFGQTQGQTFSSALPDGIYIPLTQLEYRTAGLLEGIGQVAIERSFGNTSLSLGLQGTIDLNNRLTNTALGVDKFSNYGIHFGLRRTF